MPAPKSILLLFEDGDVREESLRYSIELARRMGCNLRILMLLEARGEELIEVWKKRFIETLERCRPEDLEYEGEIRSGIKSSELLKFFAQTSPVSTVVWGSDEGVLTREGERKKHWFSLLRSKFQYPIVTSKARRKT
jgi:hypothetical protein